MTLDFKQWFATFPRWDTIGWFTIVGVGAYWEITGALFKNRTTFTQFIRTVLTSTGPWYSSWQWWSKAAVLGVLFWHFCIAKANFK